jgi:hypothetical protein
MVLLWTVVPLVALHIWFWIRYPAAFKFQLLLNVILAIVTGEAILTGRDLNPVRCLQDNSPFQVVDWSSSTDYQPTMSDVVLYFHPWWESAALQIRDGKFPLVAPEIGAGLPLFANGQTGLLAPVMLPVWLYGPERGTTIMAFWKLELAGLGAFLLMFRAWRLRWTAAASAGVAWAACPYIVAWLLQPLSWVVAAMPWAWWAAWWVSQNRRSLRQLLLVGLGFGWLMGCGLHPETAAIVCGSSFAMALVCRPREFLRIGLVVAVGTVVALFLAWPTIGYIEASSRIALETDQMADKQVVTWGMRQDVVRQILVPASMGHPGRGDWRPEYPHAPGAAGVGGAVLALLTAGAITSQHRRAASVSLGLVVVGLILLVRLPPLDSVLMSVPPVDRMTVARFGVLIPWCVIVVATLSLHSALRDGGSGQVSRLLPTLLVAASALLAAPWQLKPVDAGLVFVSVAAAAAVGTTRYYRVAPILIASELALLAIGINPVAAPEDRRPSPEILTRLEEYQSERSCRIMGVRGLFPPNLAARYALRDLRAADPLRPAPFAKLMGVMGEPRTILGGALRDAPANLCGAWGVGLALSPPEAVLPGWTRLYHDEVGSIWSNPLLLSEVRVVGRAVPIPHSPGVLERRIRHLDFSNVALVVHTIPEISARDMKLVIETREPTQIRADVSCDGPCLLVVAQPWAPGWIARIDEVEIPITRTNIAGLGVRIPAGSHEVEFLYRPWRWLGRLR